MDRGPGGPAAHRRRGRALRVVVHDRAAPEPGPVAKRRPEHVPPHPVPRDVGPLRRIAPARRRPQALPVIGRAGPALPLPELLVQRAPVPRVQRRRDPTPQYRRDPRQRHRQTAVGQRRVRQGHRRGAAQLHTPAAIPDRGPRQVRDPRRRHPDPIPVRRRRGIARRTEGDVPRPGLKDPAILHDQLHPGVVLTVALSVGGREADHRSGRQFQGAGDCQVTGHIVEIAGPGMSTGRQGEPLQSHLASAAFHAHAPRRPRSRPEDDVRIRDQGAGGVNDQLRNPVGVVAFRRQEMHLRHWVDGQHGAAADRYVAADVNVARPCGVLDNRASPIVRVHVDQGLTAGPGAIHPNVAERDPGRAVVAEAIVTVPLQVTVVRGLGDRRPQVVTGQGGHGRQVRAGPVGRQGQEGGSQPVAFLGVERVGEMVDPGIHGAAVEGPRRQPFGDRPCQPRRRSARLAARLWWAASGGIDNGTVVGRHQPGLTKRGPRTPFPDHQARCFVKAIPAHVPAEPFGGTKLYGDLRIVGAFDEVVAIRQDRFVFFGPGNPIPVQSLPIQIPQVQRVEGVRAGCKGVLVGVPGVRPPPLDHRTVRAALHGAPPGHPAPSKGQAVRARGRPVGVHLLPNPTTARMVKPQQVADFVRVDTDGVEPVGVVRVRPGAAPLRGHVAEPDVPSAL